MYNQLVSICLFRGGSERAFAPDREWQIMGSRYQIPYQYMLPYGKGPTPNVPKFFVIACVHFAIMHQFQTPTLEVNHMPGKYKFSRWFGPPFALLCLVWLRQHNLSLNKTVPSDHPVWNFDYAGGVSLADVFRGLLLRIELINWLDPLRLTPGSLLRQDIFAWPTLVELRAGWQNLGGVRLVACLNVRQTGFPQLTEEELKELFAGPYLLYLAPSYLTSMRGATARNMPYVNLQTYHNNHSTIPDLRGFVFDQMLPPGQLEQYLVRVQLP